MAQSQQLSTQRLMRELKKMQSDPNPQFIAKPLPNNLYEWHFVLFNFTKDSPFYGGQYHGKILIPSEYPLKPPALVFLTPQGRFKQGEKICLSFTSYHPESWSSSWTIASMLIGLISFMHTNEGGIGKLNTSNKEKKILAQNSKRINQGNQQFMNLFKEDLDNLGILSDNNNQQQSEAQQDLLISEDEPQIAVNLLQNQKKGKNQNKKKAAIFCIMLFALIILIYLLVASFD